MKAYEVSVKDLIRILLKKWYIIALCTAILAGGGVVYAGLQKTTTYSMKGRVELESEKVDIHEALKVMEDRHYLARMAKSRTGCKYSVRQITSMFLILISPSGKDAEFDMSYGEKGQLEEIMKEYMTSYVEELNKITGDVTLKSMTMTELKENVRYGSKSKNLIMGAGIGRIGSVALICSWYILREALLNQENIENALGRRSLGKIGKSAVTLGAKLDSEKDRQVIDSAINDIRLHGSKAKMIGFVSPKPKQARYKAAQFANALAEEGKKVLFIDNNASVLKEGNTIETVNDKIYYLNNSYLADDPAGKLEELKKQYDMIICCSDQLLKDDCSKACAARADSVITLIREDRETTAAVRAIKEELEYIGANSDGYILVG